MLTDEQKEALDIAKTIIWAVHILAQDNSAEQGVTIQQIIDSEYFTEPKKGLRYQEEKILAVFKCLSPMFKAYGSADDILSFNESKRNNLFYTLYLPKVRNIR